LHPKTISGINALRTDYQAAAMRRFFRFTIRDLLWLTLVAAVGAGWFVEQRQGHRREQKLGTELNRLRRAADGMEMVLTQDGWSVSVTKRDDEDYIFMARTNKQGGHAKFGFSLERDLPSRD
jgi:hypothetical protein